ncbi:major outer membrane protein [Campylobacter sp. LR264d]|uniref:major outer membrane protein n=1 Tax=Campylobacter sp. LR264d TaxID=2593544 RepID=UPI00123A7133|nr:major outer membrane protein [Campylobacter sp. LR264d]KAA6234556.1 major outer membrane protein [Campylobacter sp. LR264d]
MKLVKLSLVAALAAGTFSVANAVPLEEAIKDIDLSGVLRYRYRISNVSSGAGHFSDALNGRGSTVGDRQSHHWAAILGISTAISDNWKAFLELDARIIDQSTGYDSVSTTNQAFYVNQFYLTYTAEDIATQVILGKQAVNAIWTENGHWQLVGTGAKVLNQSIEGLTLAAYAFDGFNPTGVEGGREGDTALNSRFHPKNTPSPSSNIYLEYNPYSGNLYGVAAIGSYEALGGELNSQLWLAYIDEAAYLYALDLAYGTTFGEDTKWDLRFAYLGNSVTGNFDDLHQGAVDGSNFFGVNGTLKVSGFDGTLGFLYYGDKDAITFTTLSDNGNIGGLLAGEEIYYTNGSQLSGDLGQNTFGYVKFGYTFDKVLRFGSDIVYGGTKVNNGALYYSGAGDKLEYTGRIDYKYSPKLSFQGWYSYVNIDNSLLEGEKHSVRLQALYKF